MSNSSHEEKGERRLIEQCLFRGSRSRARESFSEKIILSRIPHEVRERAEGRLGGRVILKGEMQEEKQKQGGNEHE